jgi:hypothetical protein
MVNWKEPISLFALVNIGLNSMNIPSCRFGHNKSTVVEMLDGRFDLTDVPFDAMQAVGVNVSYFRL